MNLDRPETRQVKPIACASVGSLSLLLSLLPLLWVPLSAAGRVIYKVYLDDDAAASAAALLLIQLRMSWTRATAKAPVGARETLDRDQKAKDHLFSFPSQQRTRFNSTHHNQAHWWCWRPWGRQSIAISRH